ncbi:MAG TPA: AzlD domain-containing protein [Rectinemataceae bacterium]|nr:AzlD domain-containing protein [Rectinemataceae bacterium]
MNEFLLIGGMAAITFLVRYAMFATAGRVEIPPFVSRALRYVPPAVLSAIIVPAVLLPGGKDLELSLGSPQLVGALVALIVGRLSGNILAVIVSGMGVFWLWQTPLVRGLLGF